MNQKINNRLIFDFNGLAVEILFPSDLMLEFARQYFKNFQVSTVPVKIQFSISIHGNFPQRCTYENTLKIKTVKGQFSQRRVDYQDGTQVKLNLMSAVNTAEIFHCTDKNLESILIQLILFWVGEKLERQGFVRAHCLGFVINRRVRVVLGDSGVGKSTLAEALLSKNILVLADEVLLLKGESAYAFPLGVRLTQLAESSAAGKKFSLAGGPEKFTLPIPNVTPGQSFPIESIVYLSSQGTYNIFYTRITIIIKFILGIGLPQMGQYLIRFNNLHFLFRTLMLRVKTISWIALRGKVRIKQRKSSVEETLQMLLE